MLPCGSGCRFVLNGIFLESVAAGESCHLKTAALPPDLVRVRLAATNVFMRGEDGAWKLTLHQAGPCA